MLGGWGGVCLDAGGRKRRNKEGSMSSHILNLPMELSTELFCLSLHRKCCQCF